MSAYVVDKAHIDLLVKAALVYGRRGGENSFKWWEPDEQGDFKSWLELDPHIEDYSEERRTPSQMGQVLVNENVRSVYHRYPDSDPDEGDLPGPHDAYYMGPYVYAEPGLEPTPAQVFKAIDCLNYQSCETDDWRRTEAFLILESLRKRVCQCVDGYEEAEWEFDGGRHPCQRCGSETWTDVDYSGCSDCRMPNCPCTLVHLAPNARYRVCSGCGRFSWASAAGDTCSMTQPNGSTCEGVFSLETFAPDD